MPLPKYDELYVPLLTAIKDGKTYTIKEVKAVVAECCIFLRLTGQSFCPAAASRFLTIGLAGQKPI